MAQLLAPSVLSLQLPDPRFSVDFANYAIDAKPSPSDAISRKYMQDLFPGQNKPLPPPKTEASRHRTPRGMLSSRELQQRRRLEDLSATLLSDDKNGNFTLEVPSIPAINAPDRSSNATVGYFVLSNASATKSTITLQSMFPPTKPRNVPIKPTRSLLDLPQPILDQVLAYVFIDQRTVSITPYQSHVSPKQRRRHRGGPNSVDIRSIMMHPALLVSKQLRTLALDVIYRDSLFVVDLCETGRRCSMDDKETGKHWGCWTSGAPPSMVKTALTRASNLRLRLPVSNTETNAEHSVAKAKKGPLEDMSVVQDSLQAVTALITGRSITPPTTRSRSASPPRTRVLRRKLSFRSAKRPDSLEFVCRGDSPAEPRDPLTRLEVVLVKPSAAIEVQRQTLEMVATCSSIAVAGYLEYYLEFEGKMRLWAKRNMGAWLGREPDAAKLLHDLNALGQSKQTPVQPVPRADVLHRERGRVAEDPPRSESRTRQRSASRTRLPTGGVAKKIKEMESLAKIRVMRSAKQPPTVEELQQIAADIRRGVY
jgi:hypothetical protein